MKMKQVYRKGPPIQKIRSINLPPVWSHTFVNDIPVYAAAHHSQAVVKLELSFQAGRVYEKHPLAARACSKLIKEGTTTRLSSEIAENVEYYGASIKTAAGMDSSSIIIYCLTKYLPEILPVVQDILVAPSFPEDEIENYKSLCKQRLKIDLSKNEVVAYRTITENIFGSEHAYGYNSNQEMYDALNREQILHHHERCYTAANCKVFIAGNFDESHLKMIEDVLSTVNKGESVQPNSLVIDGSTTSRYHEVPSEHKLQAAIRYGKVLYSRSDPDYPICYLLSTILGGFFGSRLMKSLREDKGYTYGVYSGIDAMKYNGFLSIHTEVGQEYKEATLSTIKEEMLRLIDEPVSDQELDMVKNYMLGNFLNMLDGPFNTIQLVKTFALSEMPYERFNQWVDVIAGADASEIQSAARKYLNPESFHTVVVG